MAFNQDAMTCILGAVSTKPCNGFLSPLGWRGQRLALRAYLEVLAGDCRYTLDWRMVFLYGRRSLSMEHAALEGHMWDKKGVGGHLSSQSDQLTQPQQSVR